MKVHVPFAVGRSSWALAATRLALDQDGITPVYEHMVDSDSYYNMLRRLWDQRHTFAIVEHDIIVWPGAIQELENCDRVWCTIPYYCSVGWIEDGLGCTKFAKSLMDQYPGFLRDPFPDCCAHTTYFCGLDRLIAHRMEELEIKPHVHYPGVVNLNERWT